MAAYNTPYTPYDDNATPNNPVQPDERLDRPASLSDRQELTRVPKNIQSVFKDITNQFDEIDSDELKHRQQKDLKALINNMFSNLLDDANDLGDQVNELRGFLNETLGNLPFIFAIMLVVIINLIYTSYEAYFSTSISNTIKSNCYCDPTDRVFYRTVMMVSIISWILFLCFYGLYSTFGHKHWICHNKTKAGNWDHEIANLFEETLNLLKKNESKFKLYLNDLVTTNFLDDDHCEGIKRHYRSLCEKKAYHDHNLSSTDPDSNTTHAIFGEHAPQSEEKKQSKRWCCFMFIKIILIIVRFGFRLLIVPLLQLQLFNDYAWNCLMNNIFRSYCETETNMHYIGLDHSIVTYSVYILLLIGLLFSVLINWFPKGIPQFVLLYKAELAFKALKIMINKQGQFEYMKLQNEPDTDAGPANSN